MNFRAFDEDEPRDEHGEWTDGGGGAGDAAILSQSSEKGTAKALEKLGKQALGDRELTEHEQDAVTKYVHLDFRRINNGLRKSDAAKITPAIKNIDSAIEKSKLPSPLVVFRGAGSDLVDKIEAGMKDGKPTDGKPITFIDKAFVSTSANKKTAVNFSEDYFQMKIPAGTAALSIPSIAYPGSGIGSNRSESELLLGRGHTFKVTGFSKTKDGHRLVSAELVA